MKTVVTLQAISGLLLGSVCACGDLGPEKKTACETKSDCLSSYACQANTCVPGDPIIDRYFKLNQSRVGGFDDFGSPGAAFGYVVDEVAQVILAVALRFNLPLYTDEFEVSADVSKTASEYNVATAVDPLVDDVAAYPLLESVLTNTSGIRTMEPKVAAILVEGDLQQPTPDSIFVADLGTLVLFREDGPSDTLEGSLRLREVDGLGHGSSKIPEGETIEVRRFSFEWDTNEQP